MPKSSSAAKTKARAAADGLHQLRMRNPAAQLDVGRARRGFRDPLHLRPVAQHEQAAPRHGAERLHHQVDPLVGHHARGDDVVVAARRRRRAPIRRRLEGLEVHGRMHHQRLPAPHLADALGDVGGIRHQHVHAGGRAAVPHAQAVQQQPRQRALDPALHPGLAQVLVLQVPGVAHGAVDVAHMELPRARQHALRHRVGGRHDQVVAGQVELLDRQAA